ncbi:MAG: hypothetical protein WD845_18195 [Pirellulales bacterium]
MDLNEFEKNVINMLLAGEHPVLETLRQQLSGAQIKERELTGVGFFTTLVIPAEAPLLANHKSIRLGDVVAEIAGLHHGAGFVLFINDGLLDCLEGFTYDEPWPTSINQFVLSYIGGSLRDLARLSEKLERKKGSELFN